LTRPASTRPSVERRSASRSSRLTKPTTLRAITGLLS
jgi:hypothetical protein